MEFCLGDFKEAIRNGFLHPNCLSYDYVDESKFEKFQNALDWKGNKVKETFLELQMRMGRNYFRNVVLAQVCTLDYAALHFPAYYFLLPEDLSDDWLAIVDFHKKHARDHSLHQPLTAYVAANLLGFGDASRSLTIPAAPGNLLDYCVDVILKEPNYITASARRYGIPDNMLENKLAARKFWRGLFYETVLLSALFHDIGYPWQYVNRVGKGLRKSVRRLHTSDGIVAHVINDFKDRMFFLPLRGYQTRHENEPIFEKEHLEELTEAAMETHGFPGAIAFITLNDAIRKSVVTCPSAIFQQFKVEWAAMGIFMHDMEGKHKELFPKLFLKFDQDPLSSIIALADYLEEFNRPKTQFVSRARESRMKYGIDCSKVKIDVSIDGVMNVWMEYPKNANKALAAKIKKDETIDYFNPTNGYVDLSSLGIKEVVYSQICIK